MKLSKIIIKNFRGYCGEHIIPVENDITALIGKNDAGKSTILEALNIFFGEDKPERGDLNIYADEMEIVFGAVFRDLPESIAVDVSAKTNLQNEYLVNGDGEFEVVMRYACTAAAVSAKPETIIRCLHPTSPKYNDLLKLKLADLKTRGGQLGVAPTDQRVNHLWRKAIWEHAPELEVQSTEIKVDDLDSKAKAIYTNVASQYPQFFLFRVDRETSDGDSEAKDPMQLAVKEAQKEFQEEILTLQEKIQERVDQVAERALEKLHEMDSSLASKLQPTLKGAPKWTFDYRINDDRGVSLNKRGSGTRRLVLLNFFRAEAERKSATGSGNIIYAIEEPETSQHPNNQHLIIDSLLELSKDSNRQVLITSHSPQLVECLPHESVKFVEFDHATKNTVLHAGESGLIKAANSLGIHSKQKFGSAVGVVVVEGETDELFLTHSANELSIAGYLESSLSDKRITVLPAGGCDNVSFWVQTARLDELGLPYAIFIDSDRKSITDSDTKNEKLVKKLRSQGKVAIITKKREIENYIDPVHTNGAVYGDFEDAKKIIATVHTIRPSNVMRQFWPNMTAEQIKMSGRYVKNDGTDGYEIVDIVEDILRII